MLLKRRVKRYYHSLKEALPTLRGVALFDRLVGADIIPVECLIWEHREDRELCCTRGTLEAFARASAMEDAPRPVFTAAEANRRLEPMRQAIDDIESALNALGKGAPWSADIKASDEFLDSLFTPCFDKLGLLNLFAKKNFYDLAEHVYDNEIDQEIREKLDVRVAETATPAGDLD